ncbi:MAG: gfo/Idh/MocA family oxidoreductase [Isosphaeraceae bacterium]
MRFDPLPSRRELFKQAGRTAAASAVAGLAVPLVHAAGDSTIRLAIVGCGGRGTGALVNALSATGGPTRLVAMADVFEDRLEGCHRTIVEQFPRVVDVPRERRFLGFDAYKKAIDCLAPGDVVLLTTHSAFRQIHMAYAVSKGVNVFMEKTFAPDPGGCHKVLATGAEAERKNVKVACGLMCRHSVARQQMIQRIRDGEMGRIELIRAQRLGGEISLPPQKSDSGELLAQIRRPWAFHWLSSGLFMEMTIHQVDECCWIKDALPVSAQGMGGRAAGSTDCSQNLDNYVIEYTFPDGTRALVTGRYQARCYNDFATYVHGTRCAGQFSGNIHAATVHICNDSRLSQRNIRWKADREPCDPWQAEWNDFLAAIRDDRPYNEVKRSVMSNLVAIMGRAAVHTGNIVTWEETFSSRFEFDPNVASLTATSPAPVKADAQGRYPVPVPGTWVEL